MSIRDLANSLKIDDVIIDIDGEDRKGLGRGKIVKITIPPLSVLKYVNFCMLLLYFVTLLTAFVS